MSDEKPSKKLLLTEKFVVRFPPEMRLKIHQFANRCKRSVNKEILVRLEHSMTYFPTVPILQDKELSLVGAEKSMELFDIESPEIEVMLNHKLKQVLSELDFRQKVNLLRFLQSLKF